MGNDNFYVKNNEIISAYYKGSLIEYKLFAIALMYANRFFKEEDGLLYLQLRISEVRRIMKANTGGFYSQVSLLTQELTDRSIGIKNEETGCIHYISIIKGAEYKDGILTIRYNSEVEPYLRKCPSTPQKTKFTKLPSEIMMTFSSGYAFRMYEILKSKYHGSKNKECEYIYSLSELKFLLGILCLENKNAQETYEKTRNFEKAEEALPEEERKYKRWDTFQSRVLAIIEREINEKTDILVKFIPLRSGKGGAVKDVAIRYSFKQGKSLSRIKPDNLYNIPDTPCKTFIEEKVCKKRRETITDIKKPKHEVVRQKDGILFVKL